MRSRDCSEESFLTECLRQIARGEAQAFRALHDATRVRLFSLALGLLGRRDAAEDLLQEVFLTVWRKAHLFDAARGEPLAWLKCVVRHRALDALRRGRNVRIEALSEAMSVEDPSACAGLEAVGEREQVRRCFDALSPRNARLVRSIYYEGLTFPELAEREQAPVATAKSWVQRSLRQMRCSMELQPEPAGALAVEGPAPERKEQSPWPISKASESTWRSSGPTAST